MKVDFINVGPSDHSWSAEISELSHGSLFNEVKARNVLMSRNIDFEYNEEEKHGLIVVGDFRVVGEFRIDSTVH